MAETELNILLRLTDDATKGIKSSFEQVNKSFDKASVSAKKLGSELNSMGRELTHIGATLTFVGGAIQAVFIKALNDSAKDSLTVTTAMKTLSAEFERFEMLIAEAVVPVINQVINVFDNFNKAIESIPKELREQILQAVFLTSILITLGGVITIVAGKVFSLVGNFLKLTSVFILANIEIVAIVAAIGTIIYLMFKFSDTTKQVLNAMESLFLSLKQGFLEIKAALEEFVSSGLANLSKLYDALAGLPGPLQDFYRLASNEAMIASNNLRGLAFQDIEAAKKSATELKEILMGGDGAWSNGFQKAKDKAGELAQYLISLGTLGKTTANSIKISFNDLLTSTAGAFNHLSSALQSAAGEQKKYAVAAKAIAIAQSIMNAALGITAIWAKWAAFPPVAAALSAIEVAATGIQISTIQSQQFAAGTPQVPNDMMAQIHKNEMIVPATFSESIRKGDLTLSGNKGNDSFGDVNVNVYYPNVRNTEDVSGLANALGLEIQRQLRYARGV